MSTFALCARVLPASIPNAKNSSANLIFISKFLR
jgi:hypothetical protein